MGLAGKFETVGSHYKTFRAPSTQVMLLSPAGRDDASIRHGAGGVATLK